MKLLKYGLRGLSMTAALFSLSSIVQAETIRIGSEKLSITIPDEGYCHLDDSSPSDRRLLQFSQELDEVNVKLLEFFDCQQLSDWRVGELGHLHDHGYVLTLKDLINKRQDISLTRFLALMEKEMVSAKFQATLGGVKEDANEALARNISPSAKLNEMNIMGLLLKDRFALYHVWHVRGVAENGDDLDKVGVLATTLLRGKVIYFWLWTEIGAGRNLPDLQNLMVTWISETHRNN